MEYKPGIVEQWTLVEGGLAWAFIMEFNVDETIRGVIGETFFVRVPFNCAGEPIPAWGPSGRYSTWMASHAQGAGAYFPDYECIAVGGKTGLHGVMQDVRTLFLLLQGCCPLFPEPGEEESKAYDF